MTVFNVDLPLKLILSSSSLYHSAFSLLTVFRDGRGCIQMAHFSLLDLGQFNASNKYYKYTCMDSMGSVRGAGD